MTPRRRTLLLLLGAAVLAVPVYLGGALLLDRATRDDGAPARAVTGEFVGLLERGDHAGAYDRLCARTKVDYTRAEFEQMVRGLPAVKAHRLGNVAVRTVDGRRTALVTVELTYQNGATNRHTFPLSWQDDAWQVCGQPY